MQSLLEQTTKHVLSRFTVLRLYFLQTSLLLFPINFVEKLNAHRLYTNIPKIQNNILAIFYV